MLVLRRKTGNVLSVQWAVWSQAENFFHGENLSKKLSIKHGKLPLKYKYILTGWLENCRSYPNLALNTYSIKHYIHNIIP